MLACLLKGDSSINTSSRTSSVAVFEGRMFASKGSNMSEPSSSQSGVRLKRSRFVAPLLITTIGTGWLLTVHHVLPGVEWAWVLLLAMLGALVLFLSVDKVSIVVGPSLMIGSGLSILRQTGWISVDTEIPLLTIVVGSLWTAAHLLPLAAPSWILADARGTASRSADANFSQPRA
jgi:hypothetical protein